MADINPEKVEKYPLEPVVPAELDHRNVFQRMGKKILLATYGTLATATGTVMIGDFIMGDQTASPVQQTPESASGDFVADLPQFLGGSGLVASGIMALAYLAKTKK